MDKGQWILITQDGADGRAGARQRVGDWYSFSNPRTKCIHYDNCLVIKKKRFLSFPPQILTDQPSRVSAL